MIVALGLNVISAGLRRGRRKEPGGGERQERGVLLELHVVKRGLPFGRAFYSLACRVSTLLNI